MSLLQKEIIFTKWNFLDEVCIFRDSLMPEHQGIEKDAKIAKKTFLIFFLSGVDSSIGIAPIDQNLSFSPNTFGLSLNFKLS